MKVSITKLFWIKWNPEEKLAKLKKKKDHYIRLKKKKKKKYLLIFYHNYFKLKFC
jgi:hypothetical protein